MSPVTNFLFFSHFALQFLTRLIRKHKETIRRFILQHASGKDIKILDFGCGEGIFSDVLRGKSKFRYIGVDRDYDCLNFGKIVNSLGSYIASNENLCFKERIFDFIILNNVLHHMERQEVGRLIFEMKRVMTEKAFLIVVELIPRNQQRGIFFRLVTYMEKKIKKINYCDDGFFNDFLCQEFKKTCSETMGSNFIGYIFTPKYENEEREISS